jgi:lipoprotein-anchoring transpeptidase ErfK/SrfK
MTSPRTAVIAVLGVVLVVAGCGGGSDSEDSTTSAPSTSATSTAEPPVSGGGEAPTLTLYVPTGEQFRKVDRPALGAGVALEPATELLLRGPSRTESRGDAPVETQIPDGTRLEAARLKGGTAEVALSSRFMAGIPADPAARTESEESELAARLGQLTYTLTALDGVRSVDVVAGGRPVERAIAKRAYAPPAAGPRREHTRRGAKSSGVREVQARLARLRFLPRRAVDGVTGYRTQQAVMAFQAWNGLARDGIVGPQTTAALARARRPKPSDHGPAHRIEVYRAKGVALLIDHDRLRRAIHVSSGAGATPTPPGTFEVFRKEKRSWSVPFQVWLPWASYFNQGIAFHGYADVPPFPASHGCVRVPEPEARGVYRFATLGTAVIVF